MKTVNQSLAALVLSPALVSASPSHTGSPPRPDMAGTVACQLDRRAEHRVDADTPLAEVGHAELLEIADDLEALVRTRATLQELRVNLRKAIALAGADSVERRVFCFAFEGDDEPRWIGMQDARDILAATEKEIAELDEHETDLVFEMIASVREVSETARAIQTAREALSGAVELCFG